MSLIYRFRLGQSRKPGAATIKLWVSNSEVGTAAQAGWIEGAMMIRTGIPLALLSAVLFGASTPFAKLLLGSVDPWMMAGRRGNWPCHRSLVADRAATSCG
jgi:hypothetical protein